MVKQSNSERRQAIRAKRILSIQYRIAKTRAKDVDKRWQLSTTHDMSFLGLSFLSDIPLHRDDIIELNVVMSGILDIFKGYGQVVRVEKKEMGAFYVAAIKFVHFRKTKKRVKPASRVSAAAKPSRQKAVSKVVSYH